MENIIILKQVLMRTNFVFPFISLVRQSDGVQRKQKGAESGVRERDVADRL